MDHREPRAQPLVKLTPGRFGRRVPRLQRPCWRTDLLVVTSEEAEPWSAQATAFSFVQDLTAKWKSHRTPLEVKAPRAGEFQEQTFLNAYASKPARTQVRQTV